MNREKKKVFPPKGGGGQKVLVQSFLKESKITGSIFPTDFYRKKPFSSPWLMMSVTCDVLYGYFEEKRPTM